MKNKKWLRLGLAAALAAGTLSSVAQAAVANVKITEWMYKGGDGEFIEFTNLGATAIDFSGWSYADSSATPGDVSLSAFGIVAPGESVILTETDAAAFRSAWNLGADVKIIGGNTKDNLGNGDAINLYDDHNVLVDRLIYGTSPKTDSVSGRPQNASALGANNPALWTLSTLGDIEGSWRSAAGDIGSPGHTSFAPAPVPLPGSLPLLMSGLGLCGWLRRRAHG